MGRQNTSVTKSSKPQVQARTEIALHSRPFPKAQTPPTPIADVTTSTAHASPSNLLTPVSQNSSPSQTATPIMPKLTVGEADDQYEREADAVASQVVQQLHSAAPPPVQRDDNDDDNNIQRQLLGGLVQRDFGYGEEAEDQTVRMKPMVQLKGVSAGGAASPELEQSIQRERGKGQTLSESLRNPLENAFGADFSGVCIHTDNTADQLNQSIQAKAFTTGQDVFFRQGAYAPESKSGQELIAHELTHVVQQNTASVQRRYIQREDLVEDESKMDSLYASKSKMLGSRSLYLTNKEGNRLEKGSNDNPKTKKLNKDKKLQVLKSETNPHSEDLPAGDYYFIKYMEVDVDQQSDDTLNINWVYGYAKQSDINALGEYKNISAITANPNNPKQGKILPQADDDPPISQADIYQSAIADCYLQAAMIAIVNSTPDAITRLFTRIGDNDLDITFPGKNDNGMKITVQKKLFITPDGKPLYGGKKDSYLWPAFIQKAWAVYKGKYSDLPMGTPLEITTMITGRDASVTFISSSTDKAWSVYKSITEALETNKSIVFGTERWTDKKSKFLGMGTKRVMPSKSDHGGLGIAHCYAVLDINDKTQKRPDNDPDAKPKNITLTVRDPRTESGDTFNLPLEKLLDSRMVNYIMYGG